MEQISTGQGRDHPDHHLSNYHCEYSRFGRALLFGFSSLNVRILSDAILNMVFIGALFDFMVGNELENVQKITIKLFHVFRYHGITL